jgi:hypothetical protein
MEDLQCHIGLRAGQHLLRVLTRAMISTLVLALNRVSWLPTGSAEGPWSISRSMSLMKASSRHPQISTACA